MILHQDMSGFCNTDQPLTTDKNSSLLDMLHDKAELIGQKELYSRYRTRLGTPAVNRRSYTEEDLERFERENDGFPLPPTEEELREFDSWFFTLCKDKRNSSYKKFLDITLLKAKFYKLQSPAKPKFLERLITGVGSKLTKSHNKLNGVVISGNTAEDTSSEAIKHEQAESSSNCLCLLDNTTESCPDSPIYEEIPFYEAPQSNNSPPLSGWNSSLSTPTSPKLSGIVRQRCSEFQKLNKESTSPVKTLKDKTIAESQMSKSMPSSPQNRTKHISQTIEKLTNSFTPVENVKKPPPVKDEYLANPTMAAGYVRAFVEKINKNKWSAEGESGSHPLPQSQSCSPSLQKVLANDEIVINKNHKNTNSLPKRYTQRNGIVSLLDTKSDLFNKDSSINDQEIISLSPEELFDRSWSDSESSEDDYDTKYDQRLEDTIVPQEDEESEKQKNIRYKIVEELLKTERAYVTKLHLVDQVFQFQVIVENQVHNFFSSDVITQMFSNIKSIYQFHHNFMCPQLEERMKNWHSEPRIGDLMKRNAPFLKLYSEYVKNFDNAMNLMNESAEKCPKFAAIVKEIQQRPDCANLTLQHHMLEPIQRVPRYELLLKDYLKHLPADSPDRKDTEEALQKVTEAASHSNEAMNKIEKFRKLLEIHQRLGQTVDLISPTRELVREGRVIKISARSGEKQERYIFLFNDLMLVCSEPLLGTYKIRASMTIDGMQVNQADLPNAFYVQSTEKTIELLNDGHIDDPNCWFCYIKLTIDDFNNRKQSMRTIEQAQKMYIEEDDDVGKRAPRWIKDDAASMCMLCSNQFTTFRRRHHCRACGYVVCGKCSSRKLPLLYDDNKLNRVCDKCFEMLDAVVTRNNGESPYEKRNILECKATEPNVQCGYLHISTDHCKSWCRRFFSVHDNFVMYIFKSNQDGYALSTMPLPGYTVTVIDENDPIVDRTHVFKLSQREQQVHYFKAESDQQLQKWVEVLRKVVILELPESYVKEDASLTMDQVDSHKEKNRRSSSSRNSSDN
ncbi:FYVE, RhoGEF and PH domain-containing protein 2 isoform X2 [Octopus sinensis]|uniref:FYVE, RhoGEF and PH domain-containing protein 2 isoform X2 n=1 Tax=Octopus sinensis TaxID=2607531 RepID=A0A7E6ETA5_9MOLL|nr:FYVE, RhoGEF and PH domain-containing protein 2 isoform X2 [Octopus sinensis]